MNPKEFSELAKWFSEAGDEAITEQLEAQGVEITPEIEDLAEELWNAASPLAVVGYGGERYWRQFLNTTAFQVVADTLQIVRDGKLKSHWVEELARRLRYFHEARGAADGIYHTLVEFDRDQRSAELEAAGI